MNEIFENFLEKAFDKGIDILIAIVVLLIGFKLIKVLEKLLNKDGKLDKIDQSVKSFFVSMVSILLKILLFIVAAGIVGIPTTSFITIVGSASIAVGLALQGGLSNLAGGVTLLIFKPFKVGDFVEAGGNSGTVKSITMFYTSLITPDNKVVYLPNGSLSNNTIVNYTVNNVRRLDLEFNVSYDSKIKEVKKVINEVLDNNKAILKDKDRIVRLCNHADSSLTYAVKVWVKCEDYWNTLFDLEEDIKEAFDKNKIEIPYPQLDVHQK